MDFLKSVATRVERVPILVNPRRLGVIVGILSLLLSLTILFRGATVVGVSVDEPIHMDFFRRFGGTFETDFFYGQVSWVYTHLFNVISGVEDFGNPVDTAEAYVGRHIATAFLSLIAVAGVAGIVFQVTRSKGWALVASVFLAATPMWIGHSMFNPKDIPVAVGFTIFSLALILMSRYVIFGERSFAARVFPQVLLLFGVLLTVGTRSALSIPLALAALVSLGIVWRSRSKFPWAFRALAREFLLGVVLSVVMFLLLFISLYALNPTYYSQVLSILYEAVVVSTAVPWGGSVWMSGLSVEVPPPWWYIPVFLVFQLPIFLLAPFLIWSVLLLVRLAVGRASFDGDPPKAEGHELSETVAVGVLLVQALATPVAIALGGMAIFDSIRHVLFIVPAIVVLAVLTYIRLVRSFRLAEGVGILAVSLIVVPVQVSNLSLFPYNYVYFNEVAAIGEIDQQWETDYWHLSYREALKSIPGSVPVICGYWPEDLSEPSDIPAPCDELKPFVAKERWFASQNDAEVWLIMSQRYVVGGRERADLCYSQGEVSRSLHGQTITLSKLYSCALR